MRPERSWVDLVYLPMRTILLVPMLVALFCLAALVTTGDVDLGLSSRVVDPTDLTRVQQKFAQAQGWVQRAALSALGLTSLAFLFPRNLFKSARIVQDRASGRDDSGFKGRGWDPIFRVVVFLCSYGFVLLVIFVLYGMVAGEDVSGYSKWRDSVPSAAFHRSDLEEPDLAWDRIALDAKSRAGWGPLASRLMDVRRKVGVDIGGERAEAAEIHALESMPWVVRLFPSLMKLGPKMPWKADGLQLDRSASQLYDGKAHQEQVQARLAKGIAQYVLSRPKLFREISAFDPTQPAKAEDRVAWDKYLAKARSLAALDTGDKARRAALQAPIRDNNRRVLQLYLADTMRDRDRMPVFASIVWAQDQWTRLRIVLIAGTLWILCCAVDVNSFSLQKFYRGHVIDSWVKIPKGKVSKRWLHEVADTYRGHEYGKSREQAPPRRASLLLINATLEGNRSLGDEPEILKHIFTFSPDASGSGLTKHWLNGVDPSKSIARRSGLDIGNIVSTSGAFLSPGNVANPALSAILHLLNIQTGYWAHDPGKFEARTPRESLLFHISQSLGVDCEGDSRFMLTDGAHVENLGLYVLLQRRCSLIVASDCSQEERAEKPERRFDALIHVLQQAQVDGIEVGPFLGSRTFLHWLETGKIANDGSDRGDVCRRPRSAGLDLVRSPDPPPAEKAERWSDVLIHVLRESRKPVPEAPTAAPPRSIQPESNGQPRSPAGIDAAKSGAAFAQEHYLFAQIVYPDEPRSRGLLVYLRPTLTGDEGDSLVHGAADSRFPDDDPIDQFYTPAKMTTYRLLGRHIAEELMRDPVMVNALGKIVRGGAATDEPGSDEAIDAKPSCEPYCGKAGASCFWNRQRTFRPRIPAYYQDAIEVEESQVSTGLNRARS